MPADKAASTKDAPVVAENSRPLLSLMTGTYAFSIFMKLFDSDHPYLRLRWRGYRTSADLIRAERDKR
jgi:hypothetical protein